jgi:hypothetical protein
MSGAELLPIVTQIASSEGGKPLRETIGSTLAEFWQGVVGDKVAAWRIKNAGEISRKLDDQLLAQGLKIDRDQISDRYAFSWFEEATKQDEPELQELFARLLLNASQGDKDALDRRHLATLSLFTPIDALVFDRLFCQKKEKSLAMGFVPQLPRWPHETQVHFLVKELGNEAANSVEHLVNLGVLARGFEIKTGVARNDLRREAAIANLTIKNEIIATGLGWSLHLALRKKRDD